MNPEMPEPKHAPIPEHTEEIPLPKKPGYLTIKLSRPIYHENNPLYELKFYRPNLGQIRAAASYNTGEDKIAIILAVQNKLPESTINQIDYEDLIKFEALSSFLEVSPLTGK